MIETKTTFVISEAQVDFYENIFSSFVQTWHYKVFFIYTGVILLRRKIVGLSHAQKITRKREYLFVFLNY